jgi:hypothetical protein
MNALNEVNKVIASVTYYPHRHTGLEEEEWLTAERMAVSNALCGSVKFLLFSFPWDGFFFQHFRFPLPIIIPPLLLQ